MSRVLFWVNWMTSRSDFLWLTFLTFGFVLDVEHRARVPEWYGTYQSGTFWMSYGWMKFVSFELHSLIEHAS
jgi:hypothetical protein